jgi:DsbC/DsbD-like thiol-disulfide interchange protein
VTNRPAFFVPSPALLIALALIVLAVCGGIAGFQTAAAHHTKIKLVSDEASLANGHPIWVGVLFQLDKGWHIYWRNPGDSGEPPKIYWRLPKGFEVGAVEWPRPTRLGSGTVIDYGYNDQVLLMAPIGSAQTLSSDLTIEATVRYVVCREICVPEKAQLSLLIPQGKGLSHGFTRWHEIFERTRAEIPGPAPAGWKISAQVDNQEHIFLSVRGRPASRDVLFFPAEPSVIDNSAPQPISVINAGFRLVLRESEQLLKPISFLKGLLVFGASEAYAVSVPVTLKLR